MPVCEDPVINAQRANRAKAEFDSRVLRDRMTAAQGAFATKHGIRLDQARSLLMDWKAVP